MFEQVLKSRRSIRRYLTDPVQDDVLNKLLEAATWAPSAHNKQPWRFAVLQKAFHKENLANAMGNKLRVDRTNDGDDPEIIERDVAKSIQLIVGSPIVIVVCLTMSDMDVYVDGHRSSAELMMAVQSTAMAVQNLLLSAHEMGLGACWRCAPLFCTKTVIDTLKLPQNWYPQALVTLGYPDEDGKTPSRFSLSKVTKWL
ncbi:MAG: nitroreductase [Chloroflexi bacterium]|nr:nitroreductase [Chloroflexota bacterium]|tara:strand:- start:241 stop:837 length:597 start_codon:yes stop_codon:yes gene_type:complete